MGRTGTTEIVGADRISHELRVGSCEGVCRLPGKGFPYERREYILVWCNRECSASIALTIFHVVVRLLHVGRQVRVRRSMGAPGYMGFIVTNRADRIAEWRR
jgi:hypothetical protein